MEVAIGSNGTAPFQREVREWQRVDPNTGALLTGRLEADRWITGPQNAYGKVVDSQNVSQPNGIQHTQRKQLEVLQARTSSGSLQVVRAQTRTVQSSSSRWSTSLTQATGGTKTTQSLASQRFSIPLQMITNGGNYTMTNGSHDTNAMNHSGSQHHHHQLITEPSSKLSSLMKNSVASSNSSSRSSPRSPTMFGSSVSQRHQHDVVHPTVRSTERGGGNSLESYCYKLRDTGLDQRENSENNRLQLSHRGRSISNDDLASSDHWDHHNGDSHANGVDDEDDDDTAEWRRVSKIRRSFQFPKSSSPPKSNRPVDLPENTVSVSRIRAELENGRRLTTMMRKNHVDLVALENNSNGTASPQPETDKKLPKKTSFLTVDSLKDIRGKLRKLSDECLYREDFISQGDTGKNKDFGDRTQEELTVRHPIVHQDSQIVYQSTVPTQTKSAPCQQSNSLESRARHRDTTSSEWYLRRKSYGFEKMVPPSNSMSRQETSTDSGIGRSGEFASWAPTECAPRGTVITLGNGETTPPKTTVTVMNGGLVPQYKDVYDAENDIMEAKRHSIAVDESKYVRDNVRNAFESKTSINLNGFSIREIDSAQTSILDENGKRHKRVEFCKTEVHFAAESGRVNIVETAGKPPPTNNFRRRRRSSGGSVTNAYLEAISSGKPVIHFGDDCKSQYEQNSQSTILEESNNVTVITNGAPDVIMPCTIQEDEPESLSDETSIRGILKNKPIKPKPYHLGENIESSESLWGVRLRPVSAEISSLKAEDLNGEKKEISSTSNSSVAERVRIVEERKEGTGYSTKINLSLSNSPRSWETPGGVNCQVGGLRLSKNPHLEDRRKSTQLETSNNCLKSTSLIMRTIRSQSCYDEPLFRLSTSQNQPESLIQPFNENETDFNSNKSTNISSRLNCHANRISKSGSTGTILLGENKETNVDSMSYESERTVKSSSFSTTISSSSRSERSIAAELVQTHHTENKQNLLDSLEPKKNPVAAPRIKVIGSANTMSHQLSQLRRMYDAAEADTDDDSSLKADEEVKLYLGHANTAPSIEEKSTELSGSWSRVKAKRASAKQQIQTEMKELPNSNVMTIELHSPPSSLPRKSIQVSEVQRQEIPMPTPRQSVKVTEPTKQRVTELNKLEKTNSIVRTETEARRHSNREAPLKVETGGARKLKDHELLYFGIQPSSNTNDRPAKSQALTNSHKLKENNLKLTTITKPTKEIKESSSNKWKLSSDKPDLLRHSPVTMTGSGGRDEVISLQNSKLKTGEEVIGEREHQGPVYENVQKPSACSRKRDVESDQMILKEMNREAEQALEAISSKNSSRDHHRRSSQRSSKPLETIDEKRSSKHNPKDVKSSRRNSDTQHQRQCCSNRSSSISSTESLTRLSGSLRTKSKNNDYVKMQAAASTKKLTPSSNKKEYIEKPHRRSTSRETHRTTTASSSEDLHKEPAHQHHQHNGESHRRSRRTKPSSSRERGKERIVLKVDENQQITRSTVRTADDRTRSSGRKGSSDSSTIRSRGGSLRSSKSEKTDKSCATKSKVSSTRSSTDSRKMSSHSKATSTGVAPPSTSSSLKRSSRDHTRK